MYVCIIHVHVYAEFSIIGLFAYWPDMMWLAVDSD